MRGSDTSLGAGNVVPVGIESGSSAATSATCKEYAGTLVMRRLSGKATLGSTRGIPTAYYVLNNRPHSDKRWTAVRANRRRAPAWRLSLAA